MLTKDKLSWVIILIIIMVCLPFIALGLYDFIELRPKMPAIHAILQNASPQDRNPPDLIKQLIDINEPIDINSLATQVLLKQFYPHISQSKYHVHAMLWQNLLPLHLTKEQQYAIFCSTAQMQAFYTSNQDKKGLNNYAMTQFGKPLDKLTPMQSAITVAISHSPARYGTDPNRLQMRANWLLEQLANQNNLAKN